MISSSTRPLLPSPEALQQVAFHYVNQKVALIDKPDILFCKLSGSHAYGLATEDSGLDWKRNILKFTIVGRFGLCCGVCKQLL